MLTTANALIEKTKELTYRRDAPIVDSSYKLFLLAQAVKNRKVSGPIDYSVISEDILLSKGVYIAPEECSDTFKKNVFLVEKSHKIEITATLATIIFMLYNGGDKPILTLLIFLLLPFIFNFYSAVVVSVKIMFFTPEKLIPAVNRRAISLKSAAVVIASRNEPFAVAKMTFDSAMSLTYPADQKEIIVVDNSDISFAEYSVWKEYVESYGDSGSKKVAGVRVVFIHRDGTEGFKPRNLDIALKEVTAEFLLYLDVDSTVKADTLMRIVPMFGWDEAIGFIQLYTTPTNAKGKSSLALAQSIRNYFLRLEMVFFMHSSHSLFYGHNAIWRTSLVRSMGTCLEYHRNEVVVTEDLSMSLRARFSGFYGVGAWLESGEWVPESMRETEAMWLRWTFGTFQVYAKHFTQIKNLKKFSRTEFWGWLQNFGYSINYGLVPFYAGFGLLLNSTVLMWMVAMSLLPEMVQAICALSKLSLDEMPLRRKIVKIYAAFFILGTFITWVRSKGLLRYLARVKQGWTPTGKSSEHEISFFRVIKERHVFLLFGVSCCAYSVFLLMTNTASVGHSLLVALVGLYGFNSLLCVVLFGKARMQEALVDAVKQRHIDFFAGFYLKERS